MTMQPIAPDLPAHHQHIAAIWNAACGESLAFTPHFAEFNLRATTGIVQAGQFVLHDQQPIAFVIASTAPGRAGWIDAIAVHPQHQRKGVGRDLLQWAEQWLRQQNPKRIRVGGSMRPFAAGVPVALGSEPFFARHGFERDDITVDLGCDLARDLVVYRAAQNVEVKPAAEDEAPAMDEFLRRAFPGRWHVEWLEHLREGGRSSDYMALWANDSGARRVEGFCQVTFEDSLRPLDRFYPAPLPKPWGQLGTIGVSAECRGKGYAAAVINAALLRLRDAGVRGCIIDWTDLIDFYTRFGFKVHRHYAMISKGF